MKVRAVWEFDADVDDVDRRYVDVPGLAKELAEYELKHVLEHTLLTVDDFEFSVVID